MSISPELEAGLVNYFAEMQRQRAVATEAQLARLTPRERWLVRESAVMGYVQGARSTLGGHRAEIPHDTDIVNLVVEHCQSFTDLYPLLGGDVRDLVQYLVRHHEPVETARVVSAVVGLGSFTEEATTASIADLVDDEILADDDGHLSFKDDDDEDEGE